MNKEIKSEIRDAKYNEAYLQNLIYKAKNTWKGVDADKWLRDLRGNYEE